MSENPMVVVRMQGMLSGARAARWTCLGTESATKRRVELEEGFDDV